MLYSRQIHTFLVESISINVFKKEKKIDLDRKNAEAITKKCLRCSSSSLDVRNFEKYLQRSPFS